MALSQYQRAQILLHRAADQTYNEIASAVGVDKTVVAAVINEIEEESKREGAGRVVGREVLRGYAELIGFEMADEFIENILNITT